MQTGQVFGSGKVRKLFGSAITPDGLVNYLPTIISDLPQKYIITGDPGTGKSTLLDKVVQQAVCKGFDVEAYYCPLSPDKIEHVVIPGLEIALTTSIDPHLYSDTRNARITNMNECRIEKIVNKRADEALESKQVFETLLEKAVAFINKAKSVNDLVETYYVPNINFGEIQTLFDNTLKRVLAHSTK